MDPNHLAATIQNQSSQIAELQSHLIARDRQLELILAKFDGISVSKLVPSTSNIETSSPKTPKSVPRTPAAKKTPTPVTKSSANKSTKPPSKPSPKRGPNHVVMKDLPADFMKTKVRRSVILF